LLIEDLFSTIDLFGKLQETTPMPVKITILYDNRSDNCQLQEGWGFSALIEYDGCKILFDTGGDASAFASNADKMGICFDEITHLLFSHRHWDHIAGFKEIIDKVNDKTALYVPKTFSWFLRKKSSSHLKKIRVVKALEEITPNIYSLVLKGGFWLYEQALVLKTPEGLGIITGCAHPGIVRILKTAVQHFHEKIYFVLGGFHLLYNPAESIVQAVKEFQKLGVKHVAPCHCSGDHTIRQFQEAYGPNFHKIGTGTILSF